ncbi:hypothetical protein BV22DRAFT_936382 [Leucogyrophana mollusca]|uniref:Uncharacterized protein n=1 Tax=Leucogyrophana mollusca TaxID=85980 RepID=A0ACB8AVN8_9AGAM|nr:hypothetical protein BV22DRAFT_936382 [Leucogyrophana mollusca]
MSRQLYSEGSIAALEIEGDKLPLQNASRFLDGGRLLLVFIGLFMSVLLVTLDQTIACLFSDRRSLRSHA